MSESLSMCVDTDVTAAETAGTSIATGCSTSASPSPEGKGRPREGSSLIDEEMVSTQYGSSNSSHWRTRIPLQCH